MKQFKFTFLVVALMMILSNVGWGQSYLGLDGGFEGSATIDNTVQTSAQANKWTKNNATTTIANDNTTVRSGSNSLRVQNSSTTGRRVWAPNMSVSTSSRVVVQYYRRVANTTAQETQEGINRNGTESLSGSYGNGTANTWTKVAYAPTGTTATNNALWGVLMTRVPSGGTAGDLFIDDFCVYVGSAVDNTAPDAPTAPLITSNTNSLLVAWSAPGTGIDNGGYLVVRGTTDPSTAPNTNGIYAVNNTIAAGMTVVYQGTGTSFTDNGLSSGTNYFYRIYTYDKAYNYSTALTANGTTSSSALAPPTITAAISPTVDSPFDFTFTDDATWRGAITSITVDGTPLTAGFDKSVAGKITFTPSTSSPANLLQSSGSKSFIIIATGYDNATVSQIINPGADNNIFIFQQPAAPTVNGSTLGTQPILIIRDQYNNTTTSTASVVASVGSGTWTIGGTTSKAGISGTAAFTDLTATSVGAITGAISFTSGSLPVVTSNTFNIPAPVTMGWQITAPNTLFTIDFDNTVSGVNNSQFTCPATWGSLSPSTGVLNSDAWAYSSASSTSVSSFGGSLTGGNGFNTGGTSTTGVWAFTVSANNRALGIQPASSTWTTGGNFTLKFQNKTGNPITSLLISYKVYINNDQGRSNAFNLSSSSDNITYTNNNTVDVISPTTSDVSLWKTYVRTINLTSINISDGSYYYLRWYGGDVSGSGSRDEFALDDIQLVANSTSIVPTFAGSIENAAIDGNTNLSGDATINSSFNLISNALSIGNNMLTLNGTATSTAGTITGGSTSNLTIGGTGSLGTLNFTGGSEILNNLTMNRTLSGSATFGSILNVQGTLDLSNGDINMGANTLTLGTNIGSLGSLTPVTPTLNSYIIGNFERWIPNSTFADMYFPVGTSGLYRPAIISYTTASSGGKLMVSGYETDPGSLNGDTSITETGTNYVIDRYSKEAWWKFLTSDITGGVYDISFEANAIVGVSATNFDRLRVLKRSNNTSDWTLVGDHSPATGSNTHPLVKRIGLTGFSEFGIGGNSVDGNVLNDAPLPVTLASLNSAIIGRNIKLNWTTASEINNSGFNVERAEVRSQNLEFSKIGFIQGKGTVNTPTNYSFEDRNLQTGKYKYRLKQIDVNGNFEYFALNGEVEIGVPKTFNLSQNYPNPFNPVTKINFDLPENGKVDLRLYDMLGREIATLVNEVRTAGYYTVNFDASKLSSGIYFYRMNTSKFSSVKKMAVIK